MATQITVDMAFVDAEGDAEAGTVGFRLTHPISDAAGNQIITSHTVTATLASGAASIDLYATDDETSSPADVVYEVHERITGGEPRRYFVEIPADSVSPIRLEDLAPVETLEAVYSYALGSAVTTKLDRAGDTSTGTQTVEGAAGVGFAVRQTDDAGDRVLLRDIGMVLSNGAGVIQAGVIHVGTVAVVNADGGLALADLALAADGPLRFYASGIQILTGTGDPEGVHAKPVGTMYLRADGAPGATLYVKEDGGSSNTGWAAK